MLGFKPSIQPLQSIIIMKKTTFFLPFIMMVLSSTLTFADEGNRTVNNEDIQYMQAVVLRELNSISVPDKKVKLDSLEGKSLTIDNINNIVPNEPNRKLAAQISKMCPSENATVEDAINFFSDTIFEQLPVKEFFEKDNDRRNQLEQSKGIIQEKLKDYKNNFHNVFDSEVNNGISNTIDPDQSAKDEESSSTPGFVKFLLAFLIIVLAALGYLFFITYRKLGMLQNKYQKLYDKFGEIKDDLRKKTNELEKVQNDASNLWVQLQSKEDELSKLKRNSQQFGANPNHLEANRMSFSQDNQQFTPSEKVYYAVNCNGNAFSTLSQRYVKGQYLYKITTYDGITGKYEFINDPENVEIAKRSRSNFVDTACDIVNDDQRSYSKIITEKDGEVVYENASWRIVRKAIVRLS